ncbi:MAG TPA: SDR family NAD(P)-dependent oxidoreductase [Syntrophorhabdaceae bacterium]|nr:SDR family NAD(P)-dependent oxidoreductase [Syntrophorhabdaceae bacterium]HPU30685.1 SDR family NAD(P)-dependent oxidoreductase [Syntrophorhabdaceae bacterium]
MMFSEKVVFITGGTKGLGKAMAKAFLDEGAKVAVNGRNKEAVAKFEDEFRGKNILAFEADISDYEKMNHIADKVYSEWSKIDILINNAGIVNQLMPAEKIKKEDFDRVIDVNLKGTFYTTQIFGKKMIEQKSGRIISIASQVGFFGEKGFLPYSISKSALMIMTRSIAHEWSKYNVTACAVAPGFIKGGMNEGLIKKEVFVNFLSKRTPIERMGEVNELISLILFLASDNARYINGETITIDGGMTGYNQESLLDFIMKGK